MDSKEYYLKQLGNSSGMFERERDPVIDDTPLNVNETSTESEPPMEGGSHGVDRKVLKKGNFSKSQ